MFVQIVNREPTRVAYLRHIGPYGAPVGRFHSTVFMPWLQRHGWTAQERFGISHDDPAVTLPDHCRYDACVTLPPGFVPPEQMALATIPGGRYAVLAFEGTNREIAGAWQHLCRDWLPAQGLRPGADPGFEHYPADARYDRATGVFTCNICIPVVPL